MSGDTSFHPIETPGTTAAVDPCSDILGGNLVRVLVPDQIVQISSKLGDWKSGGHGCVLDLQSLTEKLNAPQQGLSKLKYEAFGEMLKENDIHDPAELVAACCFVQSEAGKFARSPNREAERRKHYAESSDGNINLSVALNEGFAECAEYALFAAAALQSAGINAQYFGGAVLFDREYEFPESHGVVLIEHDNKTYILDIYNPHTPELNGQAWPKFPSLYEVSSSFEQGVLKANRPLFFEAKRIADNATAYFGVSTGTAVDESHFAPV